MHYKKIKARIVSIVAAATMLVTSVPVYAEDLTDSVIETVEITTSDSENQSESNDNAGDEQSCSEVAELTVTVTEVTPQPDANSSDGVSEETPVETPADIIQVEEAINDDDAQAVTLTPEVNDAPVVEEVSSQDNEIIEQNSEVAPVSEEKTKEVANVVPNENGNEPNTQVQSFSNENPGQVGKITDPYQDLLDNHDNEANKQNSTLNYTKELSDVRVSVSSTGYYNAIFTITETEETSGTVKIYNYTVSGFKTEELARAYADDVKNADRYSSGTTLYKITNADLIDADKRWIFTNNEDAENGYYADTLLCWAGTSANMLELSGWNKIAGRDYNNEYYSSEDISNEDRIFDLFTKYFQDSVSNEAYALEWLFDGVYEMQGYDVWAQAQSNTNGYITPMLKEYCSSDLLEYTQLDNTNSDIKQEFINTLKKLDADEDGDRCAMSLIVGFYKCDENGDLIYDDSGELIRWGGHVVTLVGYSTDENGIPNTVTFADSDDYKGDDRRPHESEIVSNRSNLPNIYATYPIEYIDGYWHLMNYYDKTSLDSIVAGINSLKYYSDNTKNKTDDGTGDILNDYDFSAWAGSLYYNEEYNDYFTVYQGDELMGLLDIYNRGLNKTDLEIPVTYSFVISKDGIIVKTLNYSEYISGISTSYYTLSNIIMDADNPLEEGEYTVSYIFNYDKSIQEAYYNNNSPKDINKFIVIKRVTPSGTVDYIVIPEPSSDDNKHDDNIDNQQDVDNYDVYQQLLSIFMANVNDYTAVTEQSTFENSNQTFEFSLSNKEMTFNVSDADLMNAEIVFDYTVSGDMELANGSFGGNIKSGIALTKDDYKIVKNSDGSISMIFSNAFMKKLSKGVHYFKLKIAGQTRIFKIEIK